MNGSFDLGVLLPLMFGKKFAAGHFFPSFFVRIELS